MAEELLTDAGANPGEVLPLVAFCLEELFRRTAPAHHLTVDAYLEMGGLQGSIGRCVTELLSDIKSIDASNLDIALNAIFGQLINVDAAGNTSRQRASRSELLAASGPVPQILDRLIDRGVLLTEGIDRDNIDEGAVVVLAHEVLIQEWPELREWLELNRAALQRIRRQLLNLAAQLRLRIVYTLYDH